MRIFRAHKEQASFLFGLKMISIDRPDVEPLIYRFLDKEELNFTVQAILTSWENQPSPFSKHEMIIELED